MRLSLSVGGIATLLTMLDAGVVTGGCSSDADGAGCHDYVPPSSFDAQNPAVSFSRDVMPVFAHSCAFTSCHGSAFGNSNGVFLGGTSAEKVHASIVNVASVTLPSMLFVKPGDPHESFLMRKLDGSQCVLDSACVKGSCGQGMPRDTERLDLEARDPVRRWIAQGAKND